MKGSSVSLPRVLAVCAFSWARSASSVGDVDLFDVGEMRDAALGVLHRLGDRPAQADDLDLLASVRLGVAAVAAAGAVDALPARRKASRSSCVMRPPAGPVPGTNCRSTPSSHARRRTAGDAMAFRPAGAWRMGRALDDRCDR